MKTAADAAISASLLLLVLNPYSEGIEKTDIIVFMLAHYAIVFSGLKLFTHVEGRVSLIIPSALVLLFWHFPYPFDISSQITAYRYAMELSLFAAGAMAGAAIRSASGLHRAVFLSCWVAGDTTLSVLFLVHPQYYTGAYPLPYPAWEYPALGIVMIFLMNAIIAALLAVTFRGRYLSMEALEENT